MRSHVRRLGATVGATALLSIGALVAAGTASAATAPMTGSRASHHHRHHNEHKEFECHFKHLGKVEGAFALICHEEGRHHHHH